MRRTSKEIDRIGKAVSQQQKSAKHAFAFIRPCGAFWALELPTYHKRENEGAEWQQVAGLRLLDYPPNCARLDWQEVARVPRGVAGALQWLVYAARERAELVFTMYRPDGHDADNMPLYNEPHEGSVNPFSTVGRPFWENLELFDRGEACGETYLHGGRGGSKSAYAITVGILTMVRNPLANAVALRKLQNTLKNSVYNNILTVSDRLHLGKYFTGLNGSLTVNFKNPMTGYTQQFACFGADKPETLKSVTFERGFIAFAFFEELAELDGVRGIQNLQESFFRGLGSDNALQYSSHNPPQHARNWVNVLTSEAAAENPKSVITSSYLEIPYAWNGKKFHNKANWQKKNNPEYYRFAYLGEPTDFGTVVFPDSLLDVRPIQSSEVQHLPKLFGNDFGFRDPSTHIVAAYDEVNEVLYVLSEWGQSGASNEEIFHAVRRTGFYDDLDVSNQRYIACDHEIDRIAELNKFAGTPSASSGRHEFYGCKFKPAYKTEIVVGVRWLKAQSKIVIDPACVGLISEMQNYSFVETKSGGIVDDKFTCANIHTVRLENGNAVESKDHFIDAFRYACSPVMLEQRKPSGGIAFN